MAVVLALCALLRPADADKIVGILDIKVDGVSATAALKFEKSIEDGLTGAGFTVAPRKRLQALLAQSSYVLGCEFGPCLKEVHRNTELRLVLVARITGLGPSYSSVITLIDTRSGLPTSQVADLCEVCTLEEAIATATLNVIAVVTGAGQAKVDPNMGPTGDNEPVDVHKTLSEANERLQRRRHRTRRTAAFFLAAALLAGGAGAYFLSTDQTNRGYPTVAAAGAFALASSTLLVLSRKF